jgi:hypothetical protein
MHIFSVQILRRNRPDPKENTITIYGSFVRSEPNPSSQDKKPPRSPFTISCSIKRERFSDQKKRKIYKVSCSIKRTLSCHKKILLTKKVLFVRNLFGRIMGKSRIEN